MVYVENGHRRGRAHPVTAQMLNKALVHRVIPWIYHHRVWTMDESQWPISLEHFKELDMYLAAHLRRVRSGHRWGMIRYFFKEIKKEQQEEHRLAEFERKQREVRLNQVRRVLFL